MFGKPLNAIIWRQLANARICSLNPGTKVHNLNIGRSDIQAGLYSLNGGNDYVSECPCFIAKQALESGF